MKLYQRRKLIKEAEDKPDEYSINEVQAYKTFEGTELDISYKYSEAIKTMWIACFYSSLVPMVMPVCIVALFLQYWADKYQLLRRVKTPQEMGNKLVRMGIFMISGCPFFFAVSLLIL